MLNQESPGFSRGEEVNRPDPYPWPADTPLQRAHRVARAFRAALHLADPATATRLDGWARTIGQPWVCAPTEHRDRDELLTPDDAADYCRVRPRTLAAWRWERQPRLPVIATPDGPRFRVGDLDDYQAAVRRRRLTNRPRRNPPPPPC